MSRFSDAKAAYEIAQLRLKDPIIDERQKIPAGEEVYVRPIYNRSKLHFTSDVITKVKGTYAQLYLGENFNDYSTDIASWYQEEELMPTQGRTIEECRLSCEKYFKTPYDRMIELRKEALGSCPMRKHFDKIFEECLLEAFKNAI